MKRFGGIVTRDGSPVDQVLQGALIGGLGCSQTDVSMYRDDGIVLVQEGVSSASDEARRPIPVVGDIRIDNRAEVAERLNLPRGATDHEVVLRLLESDRADVGTKIIGAFAFAVWEPSSRVLTCVRDHFGVRPFFYVDSPQFFAFASNLPALLPVCERSELDEVRIAQYLELFPADEDRTFYREIKRLPRAHQLTVTAHGLQATRYWSPDELAGQSGSGSEEEIIDQLGSAFMEAVRCRTEADAPIGSFLSGGLDSSSVTCATRFVLPDSTPVYTFSAVFTGLERPYRDLVDESRYIGAITGQPGFESAVVQADRLTPLYGLEELLGIHGQPVDPPNAYLDYSIYELASRNPVRIVLDGLEGDVTLSHGIHFLDELAVAGNWRRFFREAESIRSRLAGDPRKIFGQFGLPHLSAAPLSSFVAQSPVLLAAGGPYNYARAMKRRLVRRSSSAVDGQSAPLLVSSRLAQSVAWNERARPDVSSPASEQEAHISYLNGPYVPSLLEFAHANANHFGLESRHPMFDVRLVEKAVRMPPDLKLRDGWNRYALRAAMAGIVPDEVRWRPGKATLAPNFDLKMANVEKETVGSVLRAREDLLGEFVDLRTLQSLEERNRYRRVWPAFVLALYLKKNF